MSADPFVSYAQNGEDVVLRRALRGVPRGTYLEIGANHPTDDSITRPFYEAGWSGITVEPMAALALAHRTERPRDVQVEAVAGPPGVETVTLHEVDGTGLSTLDDDLGSRHASAGYTVRDVEVRSLTVDQILTDARHTGDLHFVVIDTEGSEGAVLAGFDLRRWRPWVLVVEATVPNSNEPSHHEWEPGVLAAGYQLCLFDGLSRFYVAEEHADELAQALSFPANVLDDYVTRREQVRAVREGALTDDVIRWRTAALTRWAESLVVVPVPDTSRADALEAELAAVRRTLSWRVTAPLRLARRMMPR